MTGMGTLADRIRLPEVSVRHYLMIAALALGLPLTIAWIGFLGVVGYDAISWIIDRAIG